MPSVEGNFCKEGFEWVANVIGEGGELHFLCSEHWHGTCTNPSKKHSFYCERHFNNKHFTIPLAHHREALAVFASQHERTDVKTQYEAYARRIHKAYATGDVLAFVATGAPPQLRTALATLFKQSAPPDNLALTSTHVILSTCADVLPRKWLPHAPPDLRDHAEATPAVLVASSYLEWLGSGGRVHPDDLPGLARAIRQVLATLPPELHALVTTHLYLSTSLTRSASTPQRLGHG